MENRFPDNSTGQNSQKKEVLRDNIDPSVIIKNNVKLSHPLQIGAKTIIYQNCVIKEQCYIGPHCIIGHPTREYIRRQVNRTATEIGYRCIVRSGSIIYTDVNIQDEVELGHNVLIREKTRVGSMTLIGTNTVIDGYSEIGDNVRMQTGVYISMYSTIENKVFLGPHSILLNDKFMTQKKDKLQGPTIKSGACIGGGAILMPAITIGENAVIGAGSLVLEDVPPKTIYVGSPAKRLRQVPNNWSQSLRKGS